MDANTEPSDPDAKDFFTLESLATYQGSTLAVIIVTNGLAALVNRGATFRRWTAFIVAMLIHFGLLTQVDDVTLGTVVLAFLNGMLIFVAAMGLNTAGVGLFGGPGTTGPTRRFFAPWW